jgi:putative transposase
MRKKRMLRPGAKYHVTARANRKELILNDPEVKELFLEVVEQAKERYDFRIDNFCIMGNHFHLIIQPLKNSNLSRIMQWILSVFAMRWNRMHYSCGHVWGGRFFSHIINGIREFLRVFDYIDKNPVEAGLCRIAEQWIYGGLWHRRQGLKHIVEDPPDIAALSLQLES